jgi:hypothetical protein
MSGIIFNPSSTNTDLPGVKGTGVTDTYVSEVTVGGTTFNQGAFIGEISSDQGDFNIVYPGAVGVTVANLGASSTYVYVDNAGLLQQQINSPTREDFTRKIFVMRIAVDTSTNLILGFEYLNNPIGHYANSIRDLYSYLLAQGVPFKKDQIITGRASDLGFDVSAGSLMEFGGTGYIYDPNVISFNINENADFFLTTRTAFDAGGNTDLPKFWDNNGVITPLGSTTLVGHRIYRFSNGNICLQYGQANYANMDLAKVGVLAEDYVLNPALKNATFFGWWIIESTATNTAGTTLTSFKEYTLGIQGGSTNSLSGALLKGNNLSDLLDDAVARTNLGLGNFTDPNTFTGNLDIVGDVIVGSTLTVNDDLLGTNGLFSGSIASTKINPLIEAVSTGASTNKTRVAVATTAGAYSGGAIVGDSVITSTSNLIIGTGASGTQRLKISSTGEATFASSVSATSGFFSGNGIFGSVREMTLSSENNVSIGAVHRFHIGSSSGEFKFSNTNGDILVLNLDKSATFASSVTTNDFIKIINNSYTDYFLSKNRTDGSQIVGFKSPAGGALEAYTNNTLALTIAASGAATFASSVTAGSTLRIFEPGNTAYKTYTNISAGLNLLSYQSDAGLPYTKTSDIVASSDGTVPSELRFFTRSSGSASIAERLKIDSTGAATFASNVTSGGTVTAANGVFLTDTFFSTTTQPNGTTSFGSSFESESVGRSLLRMATSTAGGANLAQFYNPNGAVGAILVSGSATSYNTTSDYRLKEDLKDFNGLEMISNISVYDYKWKVDNTRSYGVMAHELQEVLPDAVSGEKDAEEMQGVDYSKIVPLLIKSIQELKAEIELLKLK